MLRGTTPTYIFAFSVSLKSIKEFKIIFSQDEKSVVKTDKDCIVDETQNIVIAKLSQEETLSFSDKKYAKIQAKALTFDGNVIASDILFDNICEILDEEIFEVAEENILPINGKKLDFVFDKTKCGFPIDFGDMIIYKELPADKSLSSQSVNAVENRVVSENFARVDNEFIKTFDKIQSVEEIALGAEKAITYFDYKQMVETLNALPISFFKAA